MKENAINKKQLEDRIEEISKKSSSSQFFEEDDKSNIIHNNNVIPLKYLKNVLLKYLEALSLGNELQVKILETVIFTVLEITEEEKSLLEDNRERSSFYYNLWCNAKAYISGTLYGSAWQNTTSCSIQESLVENKINKIEEAKDSVDQNVSI